MTIFFYQSITSCTTAKKVKYFKNISDSIDHTTNIAEANYVEPRIEANDVLFVSVQTIDIKNLTTDASTRNNATEENLSYIVDKSGHIDIPVIGSIKVEGLTTFEAKELIKERATKYYVTPIVNIKFLNHFINVMGEVNRPGRLPLLNEKTSVLDAISLAGDLSIQGKRENVLLIREENGKKVAVRFSLNSTDLFQSPYYYVRNGDVIYVEPNKAKARGATTDASRDRYISLTSTLLSIIVIVYTVFLK
ncbi:MAG: polysaccharide export protein [Bacteroidetes bacterium]|nr:polysaccharide export protein [Bacteroidota bacterium]